MAAAPRPEPDVARPGCRSRPSLPFVPQNSVLMRKFTGLEQPPVREAKVRSAAIATPALWLRWSEMAAETSLSNGTQMLVHSAAHEFTTAGHPRDGTAAAGSVPNRGPEGMMRTCKNEVMRRAGTTGAEAG